MATELRTIRKASKLKLRQVVEQLQLRVPNAPRTHVGVLHIEERGTDRQSLIRAFAEIYNLPEAVIEHACARSINQNGTFRLD